MDKWRVVNMKQCKECNVEIGDKYEFCFKCSQKMKTVTKEDPWANDGTMKELIASINKLNANIGWFKMKLENNPEMMRKIADDLEKADKKKGKSNDKKP